jgi:hypothetical protein
VAACQFTIAHFSLAGNSDSGQRGGERVAQRGEAAKESQKAKGKTQKSKVRNLYSNAFCQPAYLTTAW